MDMEIVDSQIHDLMPAADWEYGDASKAIVVCELLLASMDAVGVSAGVIAPGRHFITGEVSAARYPKRFKRVAMIDRRNPDVDGAIAAARRDPGVAALRMVTADYQNNNAVDLQAGLFEPAFASAERHGMPVFILGPGFPAELGPSAAAHPGVTFIIDHLGLRQYPPLSMDADPWEKLPGLLSLARYPNVAVKVCGAQLLSKQPYPFSDVWPQLHRVVQAFGPSRLMWASDFTRLRMVKPGERPWLYSDALHFLRDTHELSPSDKAQILGATARRLLRWPREA